MEKEFAHSLFVEQIGVCAGTFQSNESDCFFIGIDKQPIGRDMTFPTTFVLALKQMVVIVGGKRNIVRQIVNKDGKEKVELLTAPWAAPGTPVVLEGADPNAEKPAKIDADKFFKIEIKISGKTAKVDGVNLVADGKAITTQKSDDCLVE